MLTLPHIILSPEAFFYTRWVILTLMAYAGYRIFDSVGDYFVGRKFDREHPTKTNSETMTVFRFRRD